MYMQLEVNPLKGCGRDPFAGEIQFKIEDRIDPDISSAWRIYLEDQHDFPAGQDILT